MKERISNWLYDNWGYILQFIGISMMLISLMFLLSCSPVKRVLADIDKVKEVRTATDALFPCLNDTTIYSTDTVTVGITIPEVSYDTTTINDTVYLTKTVKTENVKTVTIYRDKYIRDDREEKRLRGDLKLSIERQIQYLNEAIKEKDERQKAEQKGRTYFWIIVALAAVSVLSHWVRSKIFK